MKNLHLLPMDSIFDDDIVLALNHYFPADWNVFLHKRQREKLKDIENSFVVPEAFSPEYINEHAPEYQRIFLHSLFLGPSELLRLSDDAAKKIVWIVWGHDLYSATKKKKWTLQSTIPEAIHVLKKVLRGTYIREYKKKRQVARKVGSFSAIGIGYPYDEVEIRKKYGNTVPVVYGPILSAPFKGKGVPMRKIHLERNSETVNVLLGHSGFEFLEHEKYLKKLSKYKDCSMHVFLVLSYGASDERIKKLRSLALKYLGEDKCTLITEEMSRREYYEFLSTIDVAIFPFKHQSALGNTLRLAYTGCKLYFHPDGVLAKGFLKGGVKSSDCRKIGKITFEEFATNHDITTTKEPLFDVFDYQKCVDAWDRLLRPIDA